MGRCAHGLHVPGWVQGDVRGFLSGIGKERGRLWTTSNCGSHVQLLEGDTETLLCQQSALVLDLRDSLLCTSCLRRPPGGL